MSVKCVCKVDAVLIMLTSFAPASLSCACTDDDIPSLLILSPFLIALVQTIENAMITIGSTWTGGFDAFPGERDKAF